MCVCRFHFVGVKKECIDALLLLEGFSKVTKRKAYTMILYKTGQIVNNMKVLYSRIIYFAFYPLRYLCNVIALYLY